MHILVVLSLANSFVYKYVLFIYTYIVYVQPMEFGVSFNFDLQFQSDWLFSTERAKET